MISAPQPTLIDDVSKLKSLENRKRARASGGVIVDGERGCQIQFAKCCNPLPGDSIIGFITKGFGVSIHKKDCPNVASSQQNEENLTRWISAEWENGGEFNLGAGETYEAMIQITAADGIGVMAGITMALADMKVSISQINTQVTKNSYAIINLHVACKSTSHYEAIVSKLRSVPSVITVKRGFSN